MATEPECRGTGLGTAVLEAILDHVSCLGHGLVWCHARVPAVGFYERAGFVTRGEQWDEPLIGPHIVMLLRAATPGGIDGQDQKPFS